MTRLPPAWRKSLPGLLLALLAVLVLYWRTGLAMVEIWERSETFAHAFVVPPIALWLIWRQRAALALHTPQPAPVFLLPLIAAALVWLLGDLVAVNSVTQMAFVAMLVLCVPLMLGRAVTWAIAFPLAFLFFCVPFGEFMMPQMMEWTADFTVLAVRASGVPVYREGLHFIIPSGSWSVVEACSGIRYLIASLMVGTLFAYLNYRSMKRRLIFIAVSFALPLVANWLRAYMIVMLGHLSGNAIATGVDHIIYGWLFFGLVMLILFTVGMRWSEPDAPLPAAESAPPARAKGGYVWTTAVALAVLVAPMLALRSLAPQDGRAELPVLMGPPDLTASGWQLAPPTLDGFKPHFEHPRGEIQADYKVEGGAPVGLYMAYYRHQNYESKLISSSNVLAPADHSAWLSIDRGRTEVADTQWRFAELRTADLTHASSARRLLALQLYWINGRWTVSDTLAKLSTAQAQLTGRGDDSAVLVLYVDTADGDDALLRRFAQENFARIGTWLSAVRDADRHAGQRE